MKLFASRGFFPLLCLAIGLAVFGVAYTLLGLSQGGKGVVREQSAGERLMHAIVGDDDEKLEGLLDAGVNPNAMYEGVLPLQMALEGDSKTTYRKVELLLKHGADPNMQDARGRTPMHAAARSGTEPITKILMDAGGDPHIATTWHYTPYEEAVGNGSKGAVVAIDERFPRYTLADRQKWDSLRIGGVVNQGIKEAVDPQSGLTDAQRKSHLRATVDKLVSEKQRFRQS